MPLFLQLVSTLSFVPRAYCIVTSLQATTVSQPTENQEENIMSRLNELFEATLVVGLAAFFAVALIGETQAARTEATQQTTQLAQADGARHG
ncbi:hypothetical protein GCM10027296_17780 [Chitinimonas naiadis]